MTRFRYLPLLALAALSASACQIRPVYEYRIDETILHDGPVRAGGEAVTSAEELSSYPEIKIDPALVTGYEDLPESIKELYGADPRDLALADVIHLLLANSRDIKIQGYTLRVAEDQIPINKSIYDLLIQASVSAGKMHEGPVSQSGGGGFGGSFGGMIPGFSTGATRLDATNRQRNASAGVSQLLPTGAIVALLYEYTRTKSDAVNGFSSINPAYTHALTASITQPLLRGFGPLRTNADIHIAQLDRKAAAADFEALVQGQLQRALELYWNLVAAVNSYKVVVISYTAATDLLRINTAKAEAGVMAKTEVLQAKATVEARREVLIRARQVVRNIEDSLKQLLFFQEGVPNWNLELRPVQELVWREVEVDPEMLLKEAIEERAEVRAALNRLEGSDIYVAKTDSDRLPQLDAVGSFGVSGRDSSSDDAFDATTDGDFENWSVGLEFSYPLQNRQRRYLYRQALSRRDQANELLQKQVDAVTFDVRNAVRELRTARERIEITRARVESEQANLDAERKRYDVGVATSFEVLEFQEDLARAQESHILAIVDYNKAAIALEKARGTLLRAYGIVFDNPELRPEDKPAFFPVGLN